MKLQAQKRAEGQKASDVRAENMIPVSCYGPDQEAMSLSIDTKEFLQVYKAVGTSAIIDLEVDGEAYEVLVKDIDLDPVYDVVLHADLYAIRRGEEMELSVPLVFTGEAGAAKAGAAVNEILHELTVRCLPRNIPAEIVVDMALLTDIGTSITIADLNLGEGVTAVAEETDAVAVASEAKEEVEETAEEAQEAVDAVLAEKEEPEATEE